MAAPQGTFAAEAERAGEEAYLQALAARVRRLEDARREAVTELQAASARLQRARAALQAE